MIPNDMTGVDDAETARIVALLEGVGLRVNPRTGVVHRPTCPTQAPEWRPEVLPWPEWADDEDRPCGQCKPDLTSDLSSTTDRSA